MIVGIDEAGRGALAGPVVVCAACILKPEAISHIQLNDSKKMTPASRHREYAKIMQAGADGYLNWVASYQHANVIDEINILNATKRGAHVAVGFAKVLGLTDVDFKIDGNVDLVGDTSEIPNATTECIIKGDSKVPEIMLASIIAKCVRDRYMEEMDAKYPGYDFAKSKGYPSPKHMQAIIEKGPCEIHRKTFKRVKEYVS